MCMLRDFTICAQDMEFECWESHQRKTKKLQTLNIYCLQPSRVSSSFSHQNPLFPSLFHIYSNNFSFLRFSDTLWLMACFIETLADRFRDVLHLTTIEIEDLCARNLIKYMRRRRKGPLTVMCKVQGRSAIESNLINST